MASVTKINLISETTLTANKTGARNAVQSKWHKLRAFVKTLNAVATTTIDVTIEHSPNGNDWFTLFTVAQVTDNNQATAIDTNETSIFPNIRAKVVIGGGGSSTDLEVELYYSDRR